MVFLSQFLVVLKYRTFQANSSTILMFPYLKLLQNVVSKRELIKESCFKNVLHVQFKNSKIGTQTCHENLSLKQKFTYSNRTLFMSKINKRQCSRAGELVFLQRVLISWMLITFP